MQTPPSTPDPRTLRRLAWLALGGALFAGCSTTPLPPPERPAEIKPPVSAPRLPAPGKGGYYQDDGPHANPPGDLDRVPDAVPRAEPLHRFANRPYSVLGQDFVPATRLAAYRERGKASWYGRKFHGQPTSSGEAYDMYKMTAAHPTLPIPSYARVTNLANARSVVVRVNDRGPFLHGRLIDLSYTAAYKLGYLDSGSATVEVEAIVPDEVAMIEPDKPIPPLRRPGAPAASPPATPALGAPTPEYRVEPLAEETGHFLQLGAFASRENAEAFRAMVINELKESAERLRVHPEGTRFRLRLGPYASLDHARSQADAIGATLRIRPLVISR